MSVDPTATTPGIQSRSEDIVDIKCRKCEGTTAKIIRIPGRDRVRIYQCTSCSHSWNVDVGGVLEL